MLDFSLCHNNSFLKTHIQKRKRKKTMLRQSFLHFGYDRFIDRAKLYQTICATQVLQLEQSK